MTLEDDVLLRVIPDPSEEGRMSERAADLEAACQRALDAHGIPGRATVQGSVAKGTWLAGAADLDCFLLMDPALPEEDLKGVAEKVAPDVLQAPRRKYAQHPYLVGEFEGLEVDLVPAYAVQDATAHMSPVDRTPFHTAWVRKNLDAEGRDQVRLLKAWCKGTGVYGAETAIGGFSGYLLEVLVHHFGGFRAVLEWFLAGFDPARVAPGGDDQVDDDVSPVIVVDPVDPARNCAAAVQDATLERAEEAAEAYLQAPGLRFFFPRPPRKEPATILNGALNETRGVWLGLTMSPRTDRLDIVLPQFQKAARAIAQSLERAGFPVRRTAVDEPGDRIAFQWLLDDVRLPDRMVRTGPPLEAAEHADKFRSKWDGHPDALGPVAEVDGRLQVEVQVHERTPAEWLQANLARLANAKHVKAAVQEDHRILEDAADVPDAWAPAVADFILGRSPWER